MIFPDKNLRGMVCYEPFSAVNIDNRGDVTLCGCTGWMPLRVGNIWLNTIQDILNSHIARQVRDSIRDGSYRFCNGNTCGIINNGGLVSASRQDHLSGWPAYELYKDETQPKIPTTYYISGDRVCNLSCPSCRKSIIKHDALARQKHQDAMASLNSQLFGGTSEHQLDIHASTSGEVFASPLLLEFLRDFPIDRYPNAGFLFQTNGLMLKKKWPDIAHLHSRVKQLTITIDSCRKAPYEILRRGGGYEDMVENVEFASLLSIKKLHLKMVLQRTNHDEVEQFYHWCKARGATKVQYTRLEDWHTYSKEEYAYHDVLNPAHDLYQATVDQLRRLREQHNDIEIFGFNI